MSNQFEELTNAELKEACKDFDIEVIANNPAKPNKTEYLEALNKFKESQDKLHGIDANETEEAPKPKKKSKVRKEQSHGQLMKLDLMAKQRVIVRDMQESQTKDEMISVSWGNRLIGRQTDFIDLSGTPQYIRKGALNNLKEASMVTHTPNGNKSPSMKRTPRFVIVETENLSEKEIAELSAQQKMRNSKIA